MAARFTLVQHFAAPLADVLAARERRFEDPSRHEGLKKQEVLERRQEGSVIVTRRAFSLADKLPDPLRKWVPADFLQLTETARFDIATSTNQFEVIYDKNPDRLRINGTTHYIAEGPQSTRREYDIRVAVNMPIVGGIVENQIAGLFRKSIEKDHEILQEILARKS
ncbi:MAG: DUF2505 family protein [Turneriella sp.]|nr:DUF2505 family protein [Turneriella sp.]